MGEKRVSLRQDGEMRFVARTGSDHEIAMDNATGLSAARPSEVLLAALAGCTAMDVASILRKKRQQWDSYTVEVQGVQREEKPDVFLEIVVLHVVAGDAVEVEAVRRAIELSATKYCTVSAQISSGVGRISHRYLVRRPGSAVGAGAPVEESGEVVVTGPGRDVLGNRPGPETAPIA